MGGVEVCFGSWCTMIGSCKRTILKMLAQLPDMRRLKCVGRSYQRGFGVVCDTHVFQISIAPHTP